MPELPEVEALRSFLDERLPGRTITRFELAAFSALKTYDPGPEALIGLEISAVRRHGKFCDIDAQGIHLVFHLARAGWLTWHGVAPATPARPGKGPLALRVTFEGAPSGAGTDGGGGAGG